MALLRILRSAQGKVRQLSTTSALCSKGDKRGVVYDSADAAVADIHDGAKLLIGGFGWCGIPENLITGLMRTGVRDLNVVSYTAGTEEFGVGTMLREKRIRHLTASYVGENADLEHQYHAGELELELCPMGTLAERCRSGGAGIPAFYTPTGHGTLVEYGGIPIRLRPDGSPLLVSPPKETRSFGGIDYVMEEAIRGDFSLIKAWKADRMGNVIFRKSARNSNYPLARAADITIVEVEEIVEVGELDPGFIHLSSIYVNRIVKGQQFLKPIERLRYRDTDKGPRKLSQAEKRRAKIARRAALEFHDGAYVSLGIGIPVMAVDYVPENVEVRLHSENGIMGMGPYPLEGEEDPDLINASKETITTRPGASFFGSDEAFSQVRGGHMDLTMLGGMQVSQYGDLANWMIPVYLGANPPKGHFMSVQGEKVKGMGGAMDLTAAPNTRVVVTMEHKAKNGDPKVVGECDLPVTGVRCVDRIITDKVRPLPEQGEKVKGMGGAMDLTAAPNTRVVVTMEHKAKNGDPKVVGECDLPVTGVRCVDRIITDKVRPLPEQGEKVKGMGGAMDLTAAPNTRVVVTMEHKAKNGDPKVVGECDLPVTGVRCVDRIITDKVRPLPEQGEKVKGMGGAMDLTAAPNTRVVVTMEHKAKNGDPKVVGECDLPVTGVRCVDRIITDKVRPLPEQGEKVKGMGGAMDLTAAPNTRVVVTMEHKAKNGDPKVVGECDLPVTGVRCVDRIITDKVRPLPEQGEKVKGMGGAMDLTAAPNTRVVVTMEHKAKNGDPKVVGECDLPVTGVRCVDRIITDKVRPLPEQGEKVKGMGGAMDLTAAPNTRVVVTMEHKAKNGDPKVVGECDLPVTGVRCVDRIITDKVRPLPEQGEKVKGVDVTVAPGGQQCSLSMILVGNRVPSPPFCHALSQSCDHEDCRLGFQAVFDVDHDLGLTLVEVAEGESADSLRALTPVHFRVSNLYLWQAVRGKVKVKTSKESCN